MALAVLYGYSEERPNMQLLIAPAKKMKRDLDGFAPEGLPRFWKEASA